MQWFTIIAPHVRNVKQTKEQYESTTMSILRKILQTSGNQGTRKTLQVQISHLTESRTALAITEEFMSALLAEADELEARVRELRDLAEKLKQYPQIKGYTLMIREDADVQG